MNTLQEVEVTTGNAPRLGYSSREVAESLGCSEKHVKNLMKSGEIPSVKLGARRIVLAADLSEALARLRQHGWTAKAVAVG